jgi:sugar O-acyltransferase (sialic acid O-acetyltransferase NeuD family)
MSLRIAVFGVESIFTPEVVETARRCGYEIAVCVIAGDPEWDMHGVTAIGTADVTDELRQLPYVLPWVTPGFRYAKQLEAQAAGFVKAPSLIDPTGTLASNAHISSGVYVNAGATVGAFAVLGDFCLINRSASLGHHSVCESFVSIGPGATVAARCKIGKGTMIGAGAVIAPGVSIGNNCLVSIGAVVAKDLPNNCLAAGNPARVIQTQLVGYKDVQVP